MANEFLYLYRGGEPSKSPKIMQEALQKWLAWIKELTDKGHITHPGRPLEYSGKLVSCKQKKSIRYSLSRGQGPRRWLHFD